jgi:hypothetical protein
VSAARANRNRSPHVVGCEAFRGSTVDVITTEAESVGGVEDVATTHASDRVAGTLILAGGTLPREPPHASAIDATIASATAARTRPLERTIVEADCGRRRSQQTDGLI